MMIAPEERLTNKALMLSGERSNDKTDSVYSLADGVAVDRPLADLEEARAAALYLNNVLAFVEYGAPDKTSYPGDVGQIESVMEGLGEIMGCCRLVSLRVEQFLDLQEERK